jgi:hypothetical protein
MDKRVQKGKWLVKLEDDEGSININCLVLLLQIDM